MDTHVFQLLFLPIIGALIGWTTNVIAIKLIFRPLNPIKLPLIGYKLQGVIPKRRTQITETIAEVVETELISVNDFIHISEDPKVKEELRITIVNSLADRIAEKIPIFVPNSIAILINKYFIEMINREFDDLYKKLAQKTIEKTKKTISVKDIVKQKLDTYELEQLEELIINISKRELKHIEVMGGLIGFFIGIIQALYFYFFN